MKKLILTVCGLVLSTAVLMAQSPAPEPDTLRDPVRQIDPEPKVLPQNDNYAEDRVKITPKQVPDGVKQTLSSSTQYQGWEKASIFRVKSNNKFIVEITRGDTTRTFHFDKTGKPVSD